jgi:hypothetical protein
MHSNEKGSYRVTLDRSFSVRRYGGDPPLRMSTLEELDEYLCQPFRRNFCKRSRRDAHRIRVAQNARRFRRRTHARKRASFHRLEDVWRIPGNA